MNSITKYWKARRDNYSHHLALQVSGASSVFHRIWSALAWSTLFLGVTYLVISQADALDEAAEKRHTGIFKQQEDEIKELKKILTICLSPGDNKIIVGNELGFCGLTLTGIKL